MEPKPGSSRIPPKYPRTAAGVAEPEDPPLSLLDKLKLLLRKFTFRQA